MLGGDCVCVKEILFSTPNIHKYAANVFRRSKQVNFLHYIAPSKTMSRGNCSFCKHQNRRRTCNIITFHSKLLNEIQNGT